MLSHSCDRPEALEVISISVLLLKRLLLAFQNFGLYQRLRQRVGLLFLLSTLLVGLLGHF